MSRVPPSNPVCVRGCAVVLALVSPSARGKSARQFHNWSNYMAPGVLERLHQGKPAIKVVYRHVRRQRDPGDTVARGKIRLRCRRSHRLFFAAQITANVFQKLDKSKLPNLANAWGVVTKRWPPTIPATSMPPTTLWAPPGSATASRPVQKILGPDARIDSCGISCSSRKNLAKFQGCGIHMLDFRRRYFSRGARLSRARSELDQTGRSRKGRRIPRHQDQALCPENFIRRSI